MILDKKKENTVLVNDGIPQGERLVKPNQIAIQQIQVLEGNSKRNMFISGLL